MARILVALSRGVVIELLIGARNHGNLPTNIGMVFARMQIADSEASIRSIYNDVLPLETKPGRFFASRVR
jgi:hypothetical protein